MMKSSNAADTTRCPRASVPTFKLMKKKPIQVIIVLVIKIQCVLAVVLAISLFVPLLTYLTFPLTFPFLFLLGDESTEQFGVVFELVLVWTMAIPTALLYAWFLCRWGNREGAEKGITKSMKEA